MTERDGFEDWEQQTVRFVPQASTVPPSSSKDCHFHPTTAGAFVCTGCGKLLCEECAPDRLMSGELVRFCVHCGGVCAEVEDEEIRPQSHLAAGQSKDTEGKPGVIRKATPPPPQPEPPPTDRQLFSILVYPFAGLGAAWLLGWGLFNFVAWPVGLLFFIPYLWALYLAVERERPRPPALWSLGGGFGLIAGRLARLVISPGLLMALLYVALNPHGQNEMPVEAHAPVRYSGVLAVGILAVLALLAGMLPLIVTVLFRTGSPFQSVDPAILISLLRRSPSRYMACLVSLVVLAGFGLGVYLLLALIPFPEDLPGIGLVVRPPPAVMLATILTSVWWAIALGRYGRWVSWCLDEE